MSWTALGFLGLFLMGLIGWASVWGPPGRGVIGLVTAIGWMIDRLSLTAREPGSDRRAAARERGARRRDSHMAGDTNQTPAHGSDTRVRQDEKHEIGRASCRERV